MPGKAIELADATLEVMHTCALRFDGYRWLKLMVKESVGGVAAGFRPYVESVAFTLRLRETVEENFAAFFGCNDCYSNFRSFLR